MRLIKSAILIFLVSGCGVASSEQQAGWLADFEQLAEHMSSVYANLEWAVAEREINVYELSNEARDNLRQAKSKRAARKIVEHFVEAFDDPHFFTDNGDTRGGHGGGSPDAGIAVGTNAKKALKQMGFRNRDLDFRLNFHKLPSFQEVTISAKNPFAWGLFEVDGQRVGVVRIAQFGENNYLDIATEMWPKFGSDLTESCDIYCQWKFRGQVMDVLLGHLAQGAQKMSDLSVDAVLIDISGNGGGTDWAAVAPRIFAPPLTKCPPLGVIKHPHHADRATRRLAHIESLLAELNLTTDSRRVLESARDALASLSAELDHPCDRSAYFNTADSHVECSQLAFSPGCGVLEYLPPGSLSDVPDRESYFRPLSNTFAEGIWSGPLYVVMDRHTASASEHFLALLEANDAATFLGETTLGAGCGFIGGGVPLYLPNLDLTVRMPDCARYRANGQNEIEGIAPHIAIDWSGGDTKKAQRIHAALQIDLAKNEN